MAKVKDQAPKPAPKPNKTNKSIEGGVVGGGLNGQLRLLKTRENTKHTHTLNNGNKLRLGPNTTINFAPPKPSSSFWDLLLGNQSEIPSGFTGVRG